MLRNTGFFCVLFIVGIAGCRKMDNLPQDAHYQPLSISWEENNTVYQYQVGKNALFSRSFVTINSDGHRVFVYDFYISAASLIRFSIQSDTILDQIEADLQQTLESDRLIPFNVSDHTRPGKASIEFIYGSMVHRTSNIPQNAENFIHVEKLKRVEISEKSFFQADITFQCILKNLSDETLSELKNGRGQIAFRYK